MMPAASGASHIPRQIAAAPSHDLQVDDLDRPPLGRRNGEVHAAATIRMGPSYGLAKDGRTKRKAIVPPEPTVEVGLSPKITT